MTATSLTEAEPKPGKRAATARKQPFARSRVGNGKTLIADVDQRSLPYREYQDCVADLSSHMGGEPTAVEQAIIEEAAGLIVWCRSARAALLKGEPFDVSTYTTGVNALRRLLADIGQERRMREVVPDLKRYLEGKALSKAAGAAQ